MGDVVPLNNEPTRLVWMCGDCGCSCWYIFNDGSMECTHCGTISTKDDCEWAFPNPPKEPKTASKYRTENPDNAEFLIKLHTKCITSQSVSIVVNPDGLIYTYRGPPLDEIDIDWLRGQVEEGILMIKKEDL